MIAASELSTARIGRRLVAALTCAAWMSLPSALGLSGCSLAPVEGRVLDTLPAQRYTDALIEGDWLAIEDLSARLERRRKDMDAYAAYKALFLIEFAIDEYHENDRSGVIAWALDTARKLIDAPDRLAQQPLVLRVPPPGRYDELGLLVLDAEERQMLIDAQARGGALPTCAAEALARYYTGIVWLAHERWEVLTRLVSAGHEYEAIERLAARRRTLESVLKTVEASGGCNLSPLPPPSLPPAPEPEPPPVVEAPRVHAVSDVSSGNVLFAYDGYMRTETLPGAEALVEELSFQWRLRAQQLAAAGLPPPPPIRLVAHTDRIGSASYNQRLSWRRGQTVRALLIEQGMPADRIEVDVMGSARPVAHCAAEAVNRQLIECLTPDRRVEIFLPFDAASTK